MTKTSLVILNVYSVKLPIIVFFFVFFFFLVCWMDVFVRLNHLFLVTGKKGKEERVALRGDVFYFIITIIVIFLLPISLSFNSIYIYIYSLFILRGSTSGRSYRLEKEKKRVNGRKEVKKKGTLAVSSAE